MSPLEFIAIIAIGFAVFWKTSSDNLKKSRCDEFLRQVRFSVPSLIVNANAEKCGDYSLIYHKGENIYYALFTSISDRNKEVGALKKEGAHILIMGLNSYIAKEEIATIESCANKISSQV